MEFALSLVNLTTTMVPNREIELGILRISSSILLNGREILAAQALRADASHILWLDSDMTFPPDTLTRLLHHNLALVAANCVTRRPPHQFTAQVGGVRIATRRKSTGLQKVDGVGFAVCLMETQLLRRLSRPWFRFDWDPQQAIYHGEDYNLMERLRKASVNLWVDHDLSRKVRHLGVRSYGPSDV